MLFFVYNAKGLISEDMSFHVVDKDGKLTRSETFKAPFASMVHDFITTRDHIIFPIMPLTGSMDRAMSGEPVYAWEPEKGSFIGIMPRAGSVEDIRWFRGDPAYVFHSMNAFSDGDIVTCDVCEYGEAPLFPHVDGTPADPEKSKAYLKRWTFDLGSNSDDYSIDQLDDTVCEFAKLDERFTGLNYRHGFFACEGGQESTSGGFNALGHIDHNSGKVSIFDMGAQFATSEPVFVAKSDGAAEGEGYLVANVYDTATDKSHLMILDAENLEAGPIGKAMLDHRVPFGFHGNWKPLAA